MQVSRVQAMRSSQMMPAHGSTHPEPGPLEGSQCVPGGQKSGSIGKEQPLVILQRFLVQSTLSSQG